MMNNTNRNNGNCSDKNINVLNIVHRIQKFLYHQNEDFLKKIPRTCLYQVPSEDTLHNVWTKSATEINVFTEFQKIFPRSEWCSRFCFEADVFIPKDKDVAHSENCTLSKIPVCDASVLSTCYYYPHYPCKLQLCDNCIVSCDVNGYEVECGNMLKNFCDPNPCKNNGLCKPSKYAMLPHLVLCQCPPGFMGKRCEHEILQKCYLPQDSGKAVSDCGIPQKRWYFDVISKECHPFWYYGCFGNANNFLTYYDCRISCIIGACCWRQPLYPDKTHGYNAAGFDRYGFNKEGISAHGIEQTVCNGYGGDKAIYRNNGLDYEGYNGRGLNRNGVDRFGYNAEGFHYITRYNITGFDVFGDYDGDINYDHHGYDSEGFNRAGLNCYGYSQAGWDYYGLQTGWIFNCRAMTINECQDIEYEYSYLNQQVISFNPGKKCEEVHCYQQCGCNFLSMAFSVGSNVTLGCGTCHCEHSGHIVCPCTKMNIRKEVRDLTFKELKNFQNAVKVLHNQNKVPSSWLNLTLLYQSYFPQAHGKIFFLPWHRFFLRFVEMKLQEMNCDITIPYFDWTLDVGKMDESVVWQANYFGGDGDKHSGSCVQSHPFQNSPFEYWSPCLRRNFNRSVILPDAVDITMIIKETSFKKFSLKLEIINSLFLLYVGGHMASLERAYDPLFLSHLAFIDKIWYDWLRTNLNSLTEFPSEMRYMTMTPFSIIPDDVLLSEVQMCVKYLNVTLGAPCHVIEKERDASTIDQSDFYKKHAYDNDGYNAEGYHVSGYDRMGWMENGFSRYSFNRDGFDEFGFDKKGFNRYGFDYSGCNSNDFCFYNLHSFAETGIRSDIFSAIGYNNLGLDYFGFDTYGFNVQGYDKENCTYFFNGPFYPLFMKHAKEKMKYMTVDELMKVKRICPRLTKLPTWWIELSWLSHNNQIQKVRQSEKYFLKRHNMHSNAFLLKDFYNQWLAPVPDERFCFEMHYQSGCDLNTSIIPCPFEECSIPMCPVQPDSVCRNFGCGSCDKLYFNLVTKSTITCDKIGCVLENHFFKNSEEFTHPQDPCLKCLCLNNTVHCSSITCPDLNSCNKNAVITLLDKCCPVCSMCGSHENGSYWMKGPCHNCTCNNGNVVCQITQCEPVDCLEPVIPDGQCCPICQKDCHYEKRIYSDGDIFVPEFNSCLKCFCKNSIVRCQPVTCPDLVPVCHSPIVPDGECCPVCPKCRFNGLVYSNGEKWKTDEDPCKSCTCLEGIVMCTKKDTCSNDCTHGVIPAGYCCSPCTDCMYRKHLVLNKMQFSPPDDPCTRCVCQSGSINCVRESCPKLLCTKTEQPDGACCPICKGCIDSLGRVIEHGRSWTHPADICQICTCEEGTSKCKRVTCTATCGHPIRRSDSCCPDCSGCQFEGVMYQNDDGIPSKNFCQKCTCYNGNIECESISCPVLNCKEPLHIPGQCCLICNECLFHDLTYANGEYFHPHNEPCYNCSCKMGSVQCQNLQEFCNPQCSNPLKLNNQCCPECDGCQYNGEVYKNGEDFHPFRNDPCQKCECMNGNVYCFHIECQELNCKHSITAEGQCCAACPKLCTEEENFVTYTEGEMWISAKDPCQICICKNSSSHCEHISCPPLTCSHPATVFGECCSQCFDCEFTRRLYKNNDEFVHVDDPCQVCRCQNGTVACETVICDPVPCLNPQQVEGHCCPICTPETGCHYLDKFYEPWISFIDPMEPCIECICIDGVINCQHGVCPEANCLNPLFGHCCGNCDGCSYEDKNYLNHMHFNDPYNPCRKCICNDGLVSCQTEPCIQHAQCEYPVVISEECCSGCEDISMDCYYNNKQYKDGSFFTDPEIPCQQCACKDGYIHCKNISCLDNLCSYSAFKDCCNECYSDCWLEGHTYMNHEVFSDPENPCVDCICISGNITCETRKCPTVDCQYPYKSQCCPVCNDCFYNEQHIVNGESVDHDESDLCQLCLCNNGNVACNPKICPFVDCSHPVIMDCCPVCHLGCSFEGSIYSFGAEFDDPKDSCSKCTCVDGSVHCDKKLCELTTCFQEEAVNEQCCSHCLLHCSYEDKLFLNGTIFLHELDQCSECMCLHGNIICNNISCGAPECSHPVLLEGQCCQTCKGCNVSGILFQENNTFRNPVNPCEECICKNSSAICEHQICLGNCSHPIPDPCCPVCDGCYFENVQYNNGEDFYPDPCRSCECKDGNVLCTSEICPEIPCILKTRPPGQCCEVCRGCMYAGEAYENGQTWISSSDPCLSCQCTGGTITCQKIQCEVPCANPTPISGHCCPSCIDCTLGDKIYHSGEVFTLHSSPCELCTCEADSITCITQKCEDLSSCPEDAIRPAATGECCSTCAGLSSFCSREQIGRLMQPTQDPCLLCQCSEDYMWTCTKEICPFINCPKNEIIHSEGECCPKCKVCVTASGDLKHHESSWISKDEQCTTCTCEFGTVKCLKVECPELHCPPGKVSRILHGSCCSSCVPENLLECHYGNVIYKNGERWHPDPCTLCQCLAGKMVCDNERCLPLSCPSDEILSVDPGKCCPKCIPRPASCTAFGDPHYRTFDGAIIDFQGTCRYVLAADCYTQLFSVIVENNNRGIEGVSWTDRVVVVLQNVTVDLRNSLNIYVKGKVLKHLPYFYEPNLYIEKTSSSVLVTTDVGVKVLWNGDGYVEVTVSGTFRDKTCGLCGNFNNFPEDDMRMPSGQMATSGAEFGNSWKNQGIQTTNCAEATDLDPCAEGGYRSRKAANTKCSVLKGSTFTPCHSFVTPEPYFAACVYDICACSENDDCLCDILSAYSQECAKAGIVLNWRTAGLCDIICPEEEGLVFDECGPPCPLTCENRNVPLGILTAQCFKPCVPGCQCSADKVFHTGHCIHPSQCP